VFAIVAREHCGLNRNPRGRQSQDGSGVAGASRHRTPPARHGTGTRCAHHLASSRRGRDWPV